MAVKAKRKLKRTRTPAASAAGRILGSRKATTAQKTAAASSLAQRGTRGRTGKAAASAAGGVLGRNRASKLAKSAAASALSQRGPAKKKPKKKASARR
ncbi:MAG: hypothetical protein ABI661_10265 [Gammaproteobacteria bacterium]